MGEEAKSTGLGNTPQAEWIKIPKKDLDKKPIDRLIPGSKLHSTVLEYLLARIKLSEREMCKFYSRWRISERKTQAYIDLPDWEKILKDENAAGKPAVAVNITVPYMFATLSTISTYHIHTFAGRRPIFQLSSNPENSLSARGMETILQYQSEHTRYISKLFQMINDGQLYGVGILRTQWTKEIKQRTVWKDKPIFAFSGLNMGSKKEQVKEERVTYEGNLVDSIDPFMFLPDPCVPMAEVNKKGEFVFWKDFPRKHILKTHEATGIFKWVDAVKEKSSSEGNLFGGASSDRSLMSAGSAHPGSDYFGEDSKIVAPYETIQGSCTIIPAELGLGEETIPTKYIFTIANRQQIIQAEPLDVDHGMHPVVVQEPYSMGYGFGHLGMADYLAPVQDVLSWYINSHMDNVKTALNNMFVVDPSMIELQDLKNPGAGKIIRLKRAAYGQNVNQALTQLPVTDITTGHIRDFEVIMKMGDSLSSVSDNVRGLQDSGGRKTATEVRTSGEAAASRLAANARLISAQALVDLAEQLSINTQQNMSEEFSRLVIGQDENANPIRISPEHISGDFHYPIHDGTLPIDRVAMLDVWKELFLGIAGDEQLRQSYDLPKIFSHIAELGGAKNIKDFEINMQTRPDAEVEAEVQKGNLVPTGELTAASGKINAAPSDPAGRI